MTGITATGTGSGLDIESLVTQLMTAEKTPLTQLSTKSSTLQTKISLLGTFKSLISNVQTAATSLQNLGSLVSSKTTVGNADALSVSADNSANVGSYSVEVSQLATSQQIVSKSATFTSASQTLVSKAADGTAAAATITITSGKLSAISGGTGTAHQISISAGDDGEISLQEVADAINGSDAGVTASLITDAEGSVRLSLTGGTGEANAFKVDVATTSGVSTAAFGSLAYNPAGTGNAYDSVSSSQDSKFKLNGVTITRASNKIDDAVEGMTFNLKATTTTATSLTVSRDTSSVETKLSAFVSSYNALSSLITSKTSYDADTKTAGALQGDSTIRSIQSQMRSLLNQTFGDGTNSTKTLSSLGISFQKDGSLKLDSSKLGTAVNKDLDGVLEFLGAYDQSVSSIAPAASKDGFAYKLAQLTDSMLADDGLIETKIDSLNSSVNVIKKRYETLEARLELVEKRYRAQFTAMDSAISSMQGTASYLTQMFSTTSSSS